MANSLLTIDMITRKALEILENNLVFGRMVNRQYDDSFAKEGAKIGSTLRIRLPDRALVSDGAALQVQDDNEQFTTLAVSTQKHIGINFTSAELTMQLDDFADRVLKPRVSQLAAAIDADVATSYRNLFSSVGTPGTISGSVATLLGGLQKLNEYAVDQNNRYGVFNPAANAAFIGGLTNVFNPQATISGYFKKGLMGEGVLGFDEMAMSQSVVTHTSGTRTNGTVSTTVTAQGTNTITISSTSGQTYKTGDVFTIAGVNTVNPQTRQSVGSLQQFVITADVTASGSTTNVTVSPAIYTSVHALASVDTFPQSGAAVTFFSGAGVVSPQNLIFHKNAISLATADLLMPQGVDMASRQNHNGISMRIVRQYDINNDRMPCRIDVLYGYGVIRPQMGVRLWG